MRNISTDSLLYHSLQENKKMTENNCECWLGNMHQLLRGFKLFVNETDECLEFDDISDSDKVVGEEIETKMEDFDHCQFLMDLCSDCVNGNEENK